LRPSRSTESSSISREKNAMLSMAALGLFKLICSSPPVQTGGDEGSPFWKKTGARAETQRMTFHAQIAAMPLSGYVHVCSVYVALASPSLSARW
jgi:hypothetical protein